MIKDYLKYRWPMITEFIKGMLLFVGCATVLATPLVLFSCFLSSAWAVIFSFLYVVGVMSLPETVNDYRHWKKYIHKVGSKEVN